MQLAIALRRTTRSHRPRGLSECSLFHREAALAVAASTSVLCGRWRQLEHGRRIPKGRREPQGGGGPLFVPRTQCGRSGLRQSQWHRSETPWWHAWRAYYTRQQSISAHIGQEYFMHVVWGDWHLGPWRAPGRQSCPWRWVGRRACRACSGDEPRARDSRRALDAQDECGKCGNSAAADVAAPRATDSPSHGRALGRQSCLRRVTSQGAPSACGGGKPRAPVGRTPHLETGQEHNCGQTIMAAHTRRNRHMAVSFLV